MAVEVSATGLNCQNCTEILKGCRGCNSKGTQPFIFDGTELLRCPIKLITPFSQFCIKYYQYFQRGFLPFEGTIMHQPAKLMEAFDIIEREIDKNKKEKT